MAPSSKPLAPGSKVPHCAWRRARLLTCLCVCLCLELGDLASGEREQVTCMSQKQGRFEVSTEELPAESVRMQSAPGTPQQRCIPAASSTRAGALHAGCTRLQSSFCLMSHLRSCITWLRWHAPVSAAGPCWRLTPWSRSGTAGSR